MNWKRRTNKELIECYNESQWLVVTIQRLGLYERVYPDYIYWYEYSKFDPDCWYGLGGYHLWGIASDLACAREKGWVAGIC